MDFTTYISFIFSFFRVATLFDVVYLYLYIKYRVSCRENRREFRVKKYQTKHQIIFLIIVRLEKKHWITFKSSNKSMKIV